MPLPPLTLADVGHVSRAGLVLRIGTAAMVSVQGGPPPLVDRTILLEAHETLLVEFPARVLVAAVPPVDLPQERALPGKVASNGFTIEAPSYAYRGFVIEVASATDIDGDGDSGTDRDIERFFEQLTDFDGNGDVGTDADIEAFFRALAGAEL